MRREYIPNLVAGAIVRDPDEVDFGKRERVFDQCLSGKTRVRTVVKAFKHSLDVNTRREVCETSRGITVGHHGGWTECCDGRDQKNKVRWRGSSCRGRPPRGVKSTIA